MPAGLLTIMQFDGIPVAARKPVNRRTSLGFIQLWCGRQHQQHGAVCIDRLDLSRAHGDKGRSPRRGGDLAFLPLPSSSSCASCGSVFGMPSHGSFIAGSVGALAMPPSHASKPGNAFAAATDTRPASSANHDVTAEPHHRQAYFAQVAGGDTFGDAACLIIHTVLEEGSPRGSSGGDPRTILWSHLKHQHDQPLPCQRPSTPCSKRHTIARPLQQAPGHRHHLLLRQLCLQRTHGTLTMTSTHTTGEAGEPTLPHTQNSITHKLSRYNKCKPYHLAQDQL